MSKLLVVILAMKINFLHIPKTAGISFFYFLEQCFGKHSSVRFGTEAEVRAFHATMDLEFLNSLDVVSGHLTLQDFINKNLVRSDRITLAFVREPVERLVSEFLYWDQSKYNSSLKTLSLPEIILKFKNYLSDRKSYRQDEYFSLAEPVRDFNDYIADYSTYIFPFAWLGPVAVFFQAALGNSFFPGHSNKTDRDWLPQEILAHINVEAQLYAKLNLISEYELFASANACPYLMLESLKNHFFAKPDKMRSIVSLYLQRDIGNASDKWSLYLSEYERLFASYASQVVNLLEIGVQNGGSMEVWASYFAEGSKIVGCDINPLCAALQFESHALQLVIGDINHADTQSNIFSRTPAFDIVIDDGSHTSPDIIQTFCALFGRVNDGGLYVVEDLHCSYWQRFGGGLHHPRSAYAFFKALIDVCNHEHWGVDIDPATYLAQLGFDVGDLSQHLAHIHSVEFINSLCVVRKQAPAQNVLGLRVVRGSLEVVCAIKDYDNTKALVPDERDNPYSVTPDIRFDLGSLDLLTVTRQGEKLASQGAHSVLYWHETDQAGFSEARTVKWPWHFGPDRQTFLFTLPPTVGAVAALRWDVSDRPAWCRVHAAWLCDRKGEQLWSWRPDTLLFGKSSPDMLVMAPTPDLDSLDVLAQGFDSQALLCVPAELFGRVTAGYVLGVTVTMQLPAFAQAMLVTRLIEPAIAPYQTQLQHIASRALVKDLGDITDLLRDSLASRDQTIALQRLQLREQQVLQEQMRVELIRAEAQLDLLKDLFLNSDSSKFL